MPKPPRHAEPTEVGGIFSPGRHDLPGVDGPHPGPWFKLSVSGTIHRGRYVESGVWKSEHGARFSQLVERTEPGERSSPEYAALRLGIVKDLMESRRAYAPAEIAVGIRNHPETDEREVEILETSADWQEANNRARRTQWGR